MDDLFNSENKERLGAKLFREGDIVYIHPEIRETEKGDAVTNEMTAYADALAIIQRKYDNTNYELDIDDGEFFWDDYMLLSEEEYKNYYNTPEETDILNMFI